MYQSTEAQKQQAVEWFTQLRDQICQEFEQIEQAGNDSSLAPGKFERKNWQRPGGGGGTTSIMRGRVFEKVGVNISTVHGKFPQEFATSIPGAKDNAQFWASGISLIAHMHSPLVPAVHMNTRHIVTTKSWFGGGADLTPFYQNDEGTKLFHQSLKTACEKHDSNYYPRFKKWCDEYFYLKHRQ